MRPYLSVDATTLAVVRGSRAFRGLAGEIVDMMPADAWDEGPITYLTFTLHRVDPATAIFAVDTRRSTIVAAGLVGSDGERLDLGSSD